MPDHRSYQDPFYGWTVPKAISLCVQALKECSSLPFQAVQKLISCARTSPTLSLVLHTRLFSEREPSFQRADVVVVPRLSSEVLEEVLYSNRKAAFDLQWFRCCPSTGVETTGSISQT